MTSTSDKLREWKKMEDDSRHDCRPMAAEYHVLHCDTEGCDSYQLYDVFSPIEALNCEFVTTDGIVDGHVVMVCNKHSNL